MTVAVKRARGNRPRTLIPRNIQDEMIAKYRDGKTLSDLEREYYFASSTIRRMFILRGIERRPMWLVPENKLRKRDPVLVNRIVELRYDAFSCYEIAQMLNVSRTTVEKTLAYAGVPMTDRGTFTRIKHLRSPVTKKVLQLLEDEGDVTTTRVGEHLNTSGPAAHKILDRLVYYGLVENVGVEVRAHVWRRTQKEVRTAMAEIFPSPHLVDGPGFRLPTYPLVKVIDQLAEKEYFSSLEEGATRTDKMYTSGALSTVCAKAGIQIRTLLRWRIGAATTTSFEQVDNLLTHTTFCWWDIFNENTVRLPEVKIEVTSGRMKANRKGELIMRRELVRTYRIGDIGPDYEELNRIQRYFTEHEAIAA